MKKVNIVYLVHRRMQFSDLLFLILSKCKFQDFHITICSMDVHFTSAEIVYKKAIEQFGFSACLFITDHGNANYMHKIETCTNYNYEYSIKLDEDIIMNQHVWDYLFDNLDLLNDDENVLLSVALSSGIPTVDQFIKYNFSATQVNEISKLFSETIIKSMADINYSSLNTSLIGGYESDKFFNAVNDFPHYYKGIHPVRVNLLAQNKINEYIKENIGDFLNNRTFFIDEIKRPYLCNSFFAIKTKKWKEILNDKSLFVDAFDEVAINKYREKYNKKFIYIINSFAIHTMYNSMWEFHGIETINNIENEFYNFIFEYVKNNIN